MKENWAVEASPYYKLKFGWQRENIYNIGGFLPETHSIAYSTFRTLYHLLFFHLLFFFPQV
jgi:hypothetical protein